MALKVTHDGSKPGELLERCCMCRTPTPFWYAPFDVALCPDCAKSTRRAQLPTKQEWCAKERELNKRLPRPSVN